MFLRPIESQLDGVCWGKVSPFVFVLQTSPQSSIGNLFFLFDYPALIVDCLVLPVIAFSTSASYSLPPQSHSGPCQFLVFFLRADNSDSLIRQTSNQHSVNRGMTHRHKHAHAHARTHAHTHPPTHTHIHTPSNTNSHTRTHTHTHTHT